MNSSIRDDVVAGSASFSIAAMRPDGSTLKYEGLPFRFSASETGMKPIESARVQIMFNAVECAMAPPRPSGSLS